MKPIKVAIYTRVSTSEQSADLQLIDLTNYCRGRDWMVFGTYTDTISGATRSRPELNRLMDDARLKLFDVVLVWKFDRFARSLTHLVLALEEFEKLNIQFISLKDQVDLKSASGRLMFQIIGAMAEFERSLIRERVKAGIKSAQSKGVRVGRPRVFVPILKVEDARKRGLSWRAIAKELRLPASTVKRAWLAYAGVDTVVKEIVG
jgi:DNA invertase Pin-like site-specific DNA recombinase